MHENYTTNSIKLQVHLAYYLHETTRNNVYLNGMYDSCPPINNQWTWDL